MLFRLDELRRIRDGEITLAFRRWRRPTVKAGGTLRTKIGALPRGLPSQAEPDLAIGARRDRGAAGAARRREPARAVDRDGARPDRRAAGTRAPDLASLLGRETAQFKADMRKLKELGLTESLQTGYRLSPRRRAYYGYSGMARKRSRSSQ